MNRWAGRAASACLGATLALGAAVGSGGPSLATPTDDELIEAARHDLSRPPSGCPYANHPPGDQTRPCIRHPGTGRRVLIVGDSHAEHWMPAMVDIAKRGNWELASLTRPGCAPLKHLAYRSWRSDPLTSGRDCGTWRRSAYPAAIADYDPGLVLFGGRTHTYDIWTASGVLARDTDHAAWLRTWKASWGWTVRTLGAGGARLGAFTLQPTMKEPVPTCLAREGLHTRRCDTRKVSDALALETNRFVRAINDAHSVVQPVPVTQLVCPDRFCPAVLADKITHTDASHLTTTWARSQASAILKLLVEARLTRITGG